MEVIPGGLNSGQFRSELRSSVFSIERREWWLWTSAVLITLLLTAGIASFFPASFLMLPYSEPTLSTDGVVSGLAALVVLFDIYVFHEQHQINCIRRQLTEEVYRLSVLDPLTGLFNRRHIEQHLADEIARALRYGSSLTIVLFDLNSFKQVNDTYGHPVGDLALRKFAEGLKKATRGSDVAGRYGGDEFLAILPECRPEGIQAILKRITEVEIDVGKIAVSCSVGSADYVPGESMMEFLERADKALYANKRQ